MALLRALVDVMLPVVLVAAVGVLLARRFSLDRTTITKVALSALVPALAFQTMLTTEVSGRVGLQLVIAFVVVTLLAAGLGWAATAGSPGISRRSAGVAVAIGNNGNMGLPIAFFALGQRGLDQSVLVLIVSIVITFILAPLLYGAHEGWRGALRGMLRLPVLWAMAAALLWRATGIPLPTGVTRGIDLLAAACLPMILLVLGVQLGTSGTLSLRRPVVVASVLRVAALPVVGLAIGYAVGLRGLPLQVLTLSMAMPTAVNAFLLADEYGADVALVADTVTLSTVLSFGTAVVVTALLPTIGAL